MRNPVNKDIENNSSVFFLLIIPPEIHGEVG
jgi:hypothetical protein